MATVQALAYGGFAFGRDMMLALILGGAMLLVPAAQRVCCWRCRAITCG